ncbi:MAG: hypothetical protein GC137_04625 [Alphaproteobacteria bacterium]|nr:hypothetical protein [Alphaproteobacteria bacterium]
MRRYLLFVLTLFSGQPALAQEITGQPICFTIRNEAPYRVYGQFSTDYYTASDGTKARHTATFRLEKGGSKHGEKGYFTDRSEFCSSGPFYPGRQLELTLRTLIPIFSCKTNVELGEIVIQGKRNQDGTTKTWAVCY